MTRKLTVVFAVIMAIVPLSTAFAGGAGGALYGVQYFIPEWSSFDGQLTYVGGYGYGVSHRGARTGGFGMAFYSENGLGPVGGVGGLMSGQELKLGPFMGAVDLLTGVGGVSTPMGGYFVLFGEVDASLGFAIFDWMQASVYAGLQGMVNVCPGRPLQDMILYTPVVGIRIAWGSF